jgi:hypothetical protein
LLLNFFTIENEKIIIRFAKVFEQTYTRFLDLQKAEEQAKEAKIQLALERVRARAMAMQTSEELNSLIGTVFSELTKLELVLTRSVIIIYEPDGYACRWWMANSETPAEPMNFLVKYDEQPFFQGYRKGWMERNIKWVYKLEGEDKVSTDNFLFKETELSLLPEFVIEGMKAPKKVWLTSSFNNFGCLTLASLEPLPDEHFDIMLRFAKVFDLTYTRFNDLKQAEAQARESQIQLALERVRARTMAMQKSEELAATSLVLFQQFKDLGVTSEQISIGIFKEDENIMELYSTLYGSQWNAAAKVDLDEPVVMKKIHTTWKEQKKSLVIDITGNDLRKYNEYRKKLSNLEFGEDRWVIHIAFFSKGVLTFSTTKPFPQETIQLLERFAGVFEQTYTRFLDLQKAEAQAREAKIEAALERVRSKAMAMHSSEDLAETLGVFYRELRALDVTPRRCGVALMDKKSRMAEVTTMNTTEQGNSIEIIGKIKMAGHRVLAEVFEYWLKQKEYHTVLKGNQIKEYYQVLKPQISYPDYPSDVAQFGYYFMFKEGDVYAWTDHELTEDELQIFRRFTTVISLTYKRYKDLQQAEAQARESKIQLAMERVRARTMAMQKSDELPLAANLLFQQIQSLGMPAWSAGYCIWDDDKQAITLSMSSEGVLQPTLRMPLTEDTSLKHFREAHERGESFFVEEVGGDALKEHYAYLRTLPGVKETLDDIEKAGFPVPTFQIFHLAYFTQGFLLFITYEPVPESHDIFKRFGKVFDQTYTRFLDLQKAEAQAREAQIEAALERVRSRTMGMQKSGELKEVIQVVFEQFIHLNIKIEHTGFVMDYKARNDYDIWIADPLGVPSQVTVPYFDSVYYNRFNEAKKNGEDFFATILSFEEKNKFYQKLFEYVPGLPEDAKEFYFNCPGLAASTVLLDNVCLYIENFSGIPYSDEENNTLMRFGKVFQQTYTRFLDLKKAEANTKEAKVEAALERTRTQSMLMQHSNELDNTLRVFHEQVLLLGIPSAFSFLWLPDEDKERHIFWATWAENAPIDPLSGKDSVVFKSKAIDYPLDRNEPATAQCIVDWKSQETLVSYHVPPAGVKNYFAAWEELFAGAEHLKPEYYSDGLYYTEAFMKYGCFGVMIKSELPGEEKKTLSRFAIEFERAYTRFLDLQKAEAQAREANIEAALEKSSWQGNGHA